MSHDPFEAPKAPVADVMADQDLAARPPAVTLACRLLWLSIAVGLLSLIPGVRNGMWTESANVPGAAAIGFAFVGVMVAIELWLIHLVYRRHGWARWALLVFLIFGWIMTFSDFTVSIDQGMAAVVVDLLSGVAEMVAAGLLFLGSGRLWFQRGR